MCPPGHLLSAYTFPYAIFTASYANNSAYYSSIQKKILPEKTKVLHRDIFHTPSFMPMNFLLAASLTAIAGISSFAKLEDAFTNKEP